MQMAGIFGCAGNRTGKFPAGPLFDFMQRYHPGTILLGLFLASLLKGADVLSGAAFGLCVAYLFLWRSVHDAAVQAYRADVDRRFTRKWMRHDARFVGYAWQNYCQTGSPAHLKIYQLSLQRFQQDYGELPGRPGECGVDVHCTTPR